jgi:hypothetical protein
MLRYVPRNTQTLKCHPERNTNIIVSAVFCGPSRSYELIKGVISETAYKFRPVRYFQASSHAALQLRAVVTLCPHFTYILKAASYKKSP